MDLRPVVDTIPEYPNTQVSFFRRGGTHTLDEAYPPYQKSTTTDDNGAYSIDLWPNAEGLSETSYLAVYPGKDSFEFVLEPGDDPITAAELRQQEEWDWHTSIPPTNLELERARYQNAVNAALGDALIGYQNSVAGAISSTVHDRLDEWVSAYDLGLVGDGEPESVEALGKLLDFPSDRTLIFPDGDYDFSLMPQTERIGDLTLHGRSMGTVDLIGALDRIFLSSTYNLVLRDLTLSSWSRALEIGNTLSRDTIDLERVRMRDGTFGVISPSLVFDPTVVVDRFRAVNCVFQRMGAATPGAGAILFWIPFNNAYVHASRFDDNVCRNIQFGRNLSVAGGLTSEQVLAYQELYASAHVTDNTLIGLSNGAYDQTGHGIIIYGQNGVIIGNHTRDSISTAATKELTAIYTKCRNYIVHGNPIDNLFHSSGDGGDFPINIKGSPRGATPVSIQGYGGSVIGNPIKLYGRTKNGIRIQDEQVIVALNVIDSPLVNGVYVSSGTSDSEVDEEERGYDDVTIALNQVHGDSTLTGVTAINVTTIGDRLKVLDNVGTDVATLVRDNPTLGTPKDHTIDGNQGVRVSNVVRLSGSVPIENVDITNNKGRSISPASGNASAYLVDGSGGGKNLRIRGNRGSEIKPAAGTGTNVFFNPTGVWDNVDIGDNPADDVNPVGAQSGYNTRIAGTAAGTMWVEADKSTNIKTRALQIDTAPTNLRGPIYDDAGRWNPADCPTATAVSTTVNVTGVKKGARCAVAFIEDSASGAYVVDVEFTAKCLADGVVTVRLKNESGVNRNLNLGTIRLWMVNP